MSDINNQYIDYQNAYWEIPIPSINMAPKFLNHHILTMHDMEAEFNVKEWISMWNYYNELRRIINSQDEEKFNNFLKKYMEITLSTQQGGSSSFMNPMLA